MPFDKTMFSRQRRRQAARKPQIAGGADAHRANRRERRILATRKPPVTALSQTDLAWLEAMLDKTRVTIAPSRNYQLSLAVAQSPRILSLLRRRAGGIVGRGRWIAQGKRAEAILLRLLAGHAPLPREAIHYLALHDYRRRNHGISRNEAARIIAQARA